MLDSGDGSGHRVETQFRTRWGTSLEVEGAVSVFAQGDEHVAQAIFRDVSSRNQVERALRAANEALSRLASIDALTGLSNRRVFDERLADEVARARRHGTALSLALIDVDCFKQYNDTYGHPRGDECLRRVAQCWHAAAER